MSHPTLHGNEIMTRTATRRSEIMTLYVTRQNQEFIPRGDMLLCDIELINATCDLVGEPPSAYKTTDHSIESFNNNTINSQGTVSTVLSKNHSTTTTNYISEKTYLNHSNVNIRISGMTKGHQFKADNRYNDNSNLMFVVPTNLGKRSASTALQLWPSTPICVSAVKLEPKLHVDTFFMGTVPEAQRYGRFVEDWADSAPGRRHTVNEFDSRYGQVIYFNDASVDSGACTIPANLIQHIKLVFKVTPREVY
jgi:hypothetical protein